MPANPMPRNLLLRALPPDAAALLRPCLEPVPLERGRVLVEADAPIDWAYFPDEGVTSLINAMQGSQQLEVGLVGHDGMVSSALALGVDRTPLRTIVQVEGHGHRIAAEALRGALGQVPALRDLLLRYVQALFLQVSQTALCNKVCSIEERLARWLLLCHDRVQGNDIHLTHDFMAVTLGTRRPGVTLATHALEGTGAIRARRGVVTVLDRDKLEALASEGYGRPEAEYERLIGPLRKQGPTAARPEPG